MSDFKIDTAPTIEERTHQIKQKRKYATQYESDDEHGHFPLLGVLSYMLCTLAVVCFGVAVWDSVALIMVGEGNVFTVAIQTGAAINLLFSVSLDSRRFLLLRVILRLLLQPSAIRKRASPLQ